MLGIQEKHGFAETRFDIDQFGLCAVADAEPQFAMFETCLELFVRQFLVLDVHGFADAE